MIRRSDIAGSTLERVSVESVCEGSHATQLSISGDIVTTVEHLFSALFSHRIDNVIIEVDGPEVPIFDGSAQFWDERLNDVGAEPMPEPARYLVVQKAVRVSQGERWVEIGPQTDTNNRGLSIEVTTVFEHPMIGHSHTRFDLTTGYFSSEIAWARTFCFERDVPALRAAGLAKGGDLSNAIVFGKDGVLNEGGLKAKDEVMRHKCLDLLGDLSLLNNRIAGRVRAHMPGHSLTGLLVRTLLSQPEAWAIHR
jgi:UDP-3-O-[3-hydroxymyristoyl] N-acetylglucosamine deacetylase